MDNINLIIIVNEYNRGKGSIEHKAHIGELTG